MEFTLEEEQNDKISFLDFTIIKTHNGLSFDIYRKPTTTDIIIPKDSCHPFEQKTSAIRYYRDRLLTYRLSPECRDKEKETIKQILANNKYDPNHDIPEHKRKGKQNLNIHKQKKKWTKFTYVGKETRYFNKVFKDTNVAVAFTTNNTIGKRLSKEHNTQCKYEKSGVYQLNLPRL